MIDKTQDPAACPFCELVPDLVNGDCVYHPAIGHKETACPMDGHYFSLSAWNRRPSPASPAPQGPAGEYCLYTPTGWEQYPRKEWATACGLKVVHNTEAWDGVTNVPVSHGPSCMKCKRKPVDAAPAPRADTREAARLWEPVQGSEAIAPALAPASPAPQGAATGFLPADVAMLLRETMQRCGANEVSVCGDFQATMGSAPAPGADTREAGPLSGEWRHNAGYLCCGTLRIMRADWDTDAAPEFRQEVMDWLVGRLNAPALAPVASPPAPDLHRQQAWLEIQGAMEDSMLNPAQKCEFIGSILKGVLANPPKLGGYNG